MSIPRKLLRSTLRRWYDLMAIFWILLNCLNSQVCTGYCAGTSPYPLNNELSYWADTFDLGSWWGNLLPVIPMRVRFAWLMFFAAENDWQSMTGSPSQRRRPLNVSICLSRRFWNCVPLELWRNLFIWKWRMWVGCTPPFPTLSLSIIINSPLLRIEARVSTIWWTSVSFLTPSKKDFPSISSLVLSSHTPCWRP